MNADCNYSLLSTIWCSLVGRYQCLEAHTVFISWSINEVEGSMFLSNIATHLPDYTVFLFISSIFDSVVSNSYYNFKWYTHTTPQHKNTSWSHLRAYHCGVNIEVQTVLWTFILAFWEGHLRATLALCCSGSHPIPMLNWLWSLRRKIFCFIV